ncbi:MAG: hypothetical protein U0521_11980 [Anaerolineae bacterium]
MAIGALFAYVYFTRHPALRLIYGRLVQAGIQLLVIGFIIVQDVPLTTPIIMITSLAFAVLIVNVATNPRSWVKLNCRWMNSLGRSATAYTCTISRCCTRCCSC